MSKQKCICARKESPLMSLSLAILFVILKKLCLSCLGSSR